MPADSVPAAANTTKAAAPQAPAPTPIELDTTPVTAPARPAQGQPDLSELVITIEPVAQSKALPEALVTDPRGRRVGVEPGSLRSLAEAPYATYDSAPPPTQTDSDPPPSALTKTLTLVTPPAGHYVVQLVGRGAGAYSVTFKLVTPRGEPREARLRDQRIRDGEVRLFRFTNDAQSGPLVLRR